MACIENLALTNTSSRFSWSRRGTHGTPTGISVPAEEATVQRVVTMEPGVAPNDKDWLDWYKKQLAPLPPGVYQLIVHLAYDDEEMRGATWDHPDWGAAWRQRDLDMVKSRGVSAVSQGARIRAGDLERTGESMASVTTVASELSLERNRFWRGQCEQFSLDSLPFRDGVDLVGGDVFEIFGLACRPTDFDQVDLGSPILDPKCSRRSFCER